MVVVAKEGAISHHSHIRNVELAQVNIDAGEDVARREEAPVAHLTDRLHEPLSKLLTGGYIGDYIGEYYRVY